MCTKIGQLGERTLSAGCLSQRVQGRKRLGRRFSRAIYPGHPPFIFSRFAAVQNGPCPSKRTANIAFIVGQPYATATQRYARFVDLFPRLIARLALTPTLPDVSDSLCDHQRYSHDDFEILSQQSKEIDVEEAGSFPPRLFHVLVTPGAYATT